MDGRHHRFEFKVTSRYFEALITLTIAPTTKTDIQKLILTIEIQGQNLLMKSMLKLGQREQDRMVRGWLENLKAEIETQYGKKKEWESQMPVDEDARYEEREDTVTNYGEL